MNVLSLILTITCTYYAYQWGSGHKKQPHSIIVFFTMLGALIFTIPAYYIGQHYKEKK